MLVMSLFVCRFIAEKSNYRGCFDKKVAFCDYLGFHLRLREVGTLPKKLSFVVFLTTIAKLNHFKIIALFIATNCPTHLFRAQT